MIRYLRLMFFPALIVLGLAFLAIMMIRGYLTNKEEGIEFAKESVTAEATVMPYTSSAQAAQGIYHLEFDMYVGKFSSRKLRGPQETVPVRYRTTGERRTERSANPVTEPATEEFVGIQVVDDVDDFTWRDHYRRFHGDPDTDRTKAIVLAAAALVGGFLAFFLQRMIIRSSTQRQPRPYRHGR